MIAENNYPHTLVVLFQKSSKVQYIFTPNILDMPLLYSISSLKSMTDMRGSSYFCVIGGGGGGGGGQDLTEKGFVNFFGPQTYLQWVQRLQLVYGGINC